MYGQGRGGRGIGGGRGGRGGGRSRVNGSAERSTRGNPYTTKVPKKFLLGRVIYVGNLSWHTSWQDLKDHFKPVGNILRADVMMEEDGRSKGCGLVEFSTIEEAKEAIDTMNGTTLENRMITVREDKETSLEADAASAPRRLFVGNLHYHTRWMDLKDLFQKVGDVVRADVAEESGSGRSKGFGVVEMATVEDAERAMQILQENELHGRKIYIKPDDEKAAPYGSVGDGKGAIGGGRTVTMGNNDGDLGILGRLGGGGGLGGLVGGGGSNGCKVHVGNLSWDTKWMDLKDHMATAGPVKRADIASHEDTGRSKGWGLVEFESALGAQQAIEVLNNSSLQGRNISIKMDRD